MKKTFLLFLVTLITAFSFAQNVAINADASLPNSSAMLDVKNPNKGILIPRVALTGTADVTTIASPATSLMVYNTTAAGTGATAVVAGYYYWNGAAWVRMVASTTATNTVYKTIIPFASGGVLFLRGGSPADLGVVGFGNSAGFMSDKTMINLTNQPNFAYMLPSSGTITDITASFIIANLSGSSEIACRLFVAPGNSNLFTPLTSPLIFPRFFSKLRWVLQKQLPFRA